jgi:16S rRNA (cytosine967-C5)-methyltransferase
LSRHHSHIASAIKIIETAIKGEPMVHHLKKSFAANKKFGSNDRKSISTLTYNFYRLGHALKNKTIKEKIIAATFLCNQTSNDLLQEFAPHFNAKIQLSVSEKLNILQIKTTDIFPFENELGKEVDTQKFVHAFTVQPLLYLRIRPGKQAQVVDKLNNAAISFKNLSNNSMVLPTASKIETVLQINKEVVVQDFNSQKVFNYLQKEDKIIDKEIAVWDCCAASGGKSILLADILKNKINLHVSDVRAHILNNLKNRFKEAGIKKYHAFVADLISAKTDLPNKKYDIIICDAPCTGSGTWARTPEQLSSFESKNIDAFANMQKQIAAQALPYLDKGGLFFYITCSVFEKENEAVVNYLKEKFHLQVIQMEYLKGYEMQADTMFSALLSPHNS